MNINRTRISQQYLSDLIQGAKGKPRNRKVRDFLKKWKPTVKQNKLYVDGKQVVPYEEVDAVLKREAEDNGMPLSRDGAYHYLTKKYVGFKRRMIMDWLKSVEQLQMIHKKPYINTRANKANREGTKNYFMANNRLNLGVDLFEMPRPQWSHYRYFFVAVLQRSGYCWFIPMKNKKAATALTHLKKVFADCKKRFGAVTGVTSDNGSEFKGVFDAYLKKKGIIRRILSDRGQMCWWVEKKNSTFARIFAPLRDIYGFQKSLALALEKTNNIRSRVTKKAPVDWKPEDFTKHVKRHHRKLKHIPTKKKQPKYVVGQRVRHLMRQAMGKVAFYKSYEGLRSKKHQMWSKTIYAITQVKKLGHYLHYKVNGDWRRAHELQLIERPVVRLEPRNQRPPEKPKKKPVRKPVKAKPPRVESPPRLRRSRRVARVDYSKFF